MALSIWIDNPKKIGTNWQIRFRNSVSGYKPKYETWPIDEYSEAFVKGKVKDLKALVRLKQFDPWKEDKATGADLLISEAIRMYLTDYKREVAERTFIGSEGVLTKFRDEFCGKDDSGLVREYKLKTVTSDDIDKYIAEHTNTPGSSERYLSEFRRMYKYLKKKGFIEHIPEFKTYNLKKQRHQLPQILKEDQLWELVDYAMSEYINGSYGKHKYNQKIDIACWIIYFYTGMRTEELAYLKPADINLKECKGKIGFHKSTKTYMNRVVWIPEECHDAFRFITEGRNNNEFIIDHTRSTRKKKMGSTYYRFGRCLKAKFPEIDMPLYNLRHSAGCWYLEQGLSIMFVKNQLGHRRLDQALTYARLTGTAFEQELSRIGRNVSDLDSNTSQKVSLRLNSGQDYFGKPKKAVI